MVAFPHAQTADGQPPVPIADPRRRTTASALPARQPDQMHGLRLRLAGPDQIRAWSSGAVTVPTTLDALTGQPVPGGLCDEQIFGSRQARRSGASRGDGTGQRERFGHIELAVPCPHPWFSRGPRNPLALLLDCSTSQLAAVLASQAVLVLTVAETVRQQAVSACGAADRRLAAELACLAPGRVLRPALGEQLAACWPGLVTTGSGSRAVAVVLAAMNLAAEIARVQGALGGARAERAIWLRERLALLRTLQQSGVRPAWLLLTVLPVLPPALRPTLIQPGGQVLTSDLNRLYARVISCNTRLRRLLTKEAPAVVLQAAEQALRAAVDDLLTGERPARGGWQGHQRRLVGLSERLAGKRGRFRQHLLGKRVDYSGRAVIVPGPGLRLGQVGLPRALALELCRPFVVRWLLVHGHAATVRATHRLIRRGEPVVWTGLEHALAGRLVLLNRAPTLHRPGLQAFQPLLVEGQAIQLHPLACAAFNADFDGDTMAVHLPLSDAAQEEARERLWSIHNLLSPATGEPLVAPSKDIVLGCYALTLEQPGALGEGKLFSSPDEAALAERRGQVAVQARVRARVPVQIDAETPAAEQTVTTTVGRCLFNRALPPGLRWRSGLTDGTMDKGALTRLLLVAFEEGGPGLMAEVADTLKDLGFHWATRSGITISAFDVPQAETAPILAEADRQVARLDEQHGRGLLTRAEYEAAVIRVWQAAMPAITAAVSVTLAEPSDLSVMVRSGARGDLTQLVQLCGSRGLMVGPTGKVIPVPVRANFRQGLTPLEYWTAAPGARKGRGDTALNTARAGYLTRRLVAAAQEVIITEADCGTDHGWWLTREAASISAFAQRLRGRILCDDIVDPNAGDGRIAAGSLLTLALAQQVAATIMAAVRVRSPLTCRVRWGLCQHCYGLDTTTGGLVALGTAVGIIAAQSVGEPGTQLTLRTVHAGGVATAPDIVAGLPRVEELFEARRPHGAAVLAPHDGAIQLEGGSGQPWEVLLTAADGQVSRIALPGDQAPVIVAGQWVWAGTPLSAGPMDPRAVAATRGLAAAQRALLEAIQAVYQAQGVTIDDRHVEVILRQMSRTVRVREAGDTDLEAGLLVAAPLLADVNDGVLTQGGVPAVATAQLLGVSEVARIGTGFLAAASFQATARVLADAALAGHVDALRGLHASVLLGRRIPAGTGFGASINANAATTGAIRWSVAQARQAPAVTPAEPAPRTSEPKDWGRSQEERHERGKR